MALKDLARKGRAPKNAQKRKQWPRDPIHISEDTWLYVECKGLRVVREIRQRGKYILTDQKMIRWVHINTAIAWRDAVKLAADAPRQHTQGASHGR